MSLGHPFFPHQLIAYFNFFSQEYETKIVPWLWSFGIFIGFRFLAFLFFAIVNDLIFFYNIAMTMLWIVITAASLYGRLVVYSLYLELSDLTKLEDLAHLRVSCLSQTIVNRPLIKYFHVRWERCSPWTRPQCNLWLARDPRRLTAQSQPCPFHQFIKFNARNGWACTQLVIKRISVPSEENLHS